MTNTTDAPTIADVMTELRAVRELLEAKLAPVATERPLSIAQAVERLGLSESLLRKGIARGTIASVVVGRRRLIPAAEIRRLAGNV